jgi:hypothetical protein
VQSGSLGRFDVVTLLLKLTTSIGLLACATTITDALMLYCMPRRVHYASCKVRKTPCRPRSWANISLLELYSHRASLHGPACIVWADLTPFSCKYEEEEWNLEVRHAASPDVGRLPSFPQASRLRTLLLGEFHRSKTDRERKQQGWWLVGRAA